MNICIELKDVCKSFGQNSVLDTVNLQIEQSSCTGIVGVNGSGKSILFRLICGLETKNSGEILVRNLPVGGKYDFPKNIGILINEPGFIETFNGFDNLKFLAQIQSKISDEKIKEFMKLVGLEHDCKTKVKNYSLGMKKKLAIAQAIMEDQDILLLDEPFNALDFQIVLEIKTIFKRLKDEGKTLLLTGHNHADLDQICDSCYLLNNKKLTLFDNVLKDVYFKENV